MAQTKPKESGRGFAFLKMNERQGKPRARGITEIRGPYYTPMGKRYLQDVLETMGAYVDALKFAAGSFSLMPRQAVKELIDISRGFITIPTDDWLRLIEKVKKAGLNPKPEVGIQFGAGGATAAAELQAEGVRDPQAAIAQAKRFIDAGAYMIMIESEGITENVTTWRTDVVAKIINAIGLEKPMFEAADPEVFAWYIKNYGAEVNLFVDHSQIVQLETLRAGIWGTKSLWGRVLTYKG